MSENGVTLALDYVRKFANPPPPMSPHRIIALLLSNTGAPIKETAIYNFEKKGFFPHDRALVISEHYGIPLEKLVSPTVRRIIAANS